MVIDDGASLDRVETLEMPNVSFRAHKDFFDDVQLDEEEDDDDDCEDKGRVWC